MFSLEPILFCGKRNLHPDIQEYRNTVVNNIWKDEVLDPRHKCYHVSFFMNGVSDVILTMKSSIDAKVGADLYIKKLQRTT